MRVTMLHIDKENKYAWFWKFLITWHWHHKDNFHLFVGFYPDYENCKWWHEVGREFRWNG